jgi:D-beta-D-heptose 7-phosphate kinase/D-beta-D-heptose 1-phosphate adenosyltransferase
MTPLLASLMQLGQPRVLVLGDYLLDRCTWGNAQRISPEAPVMVLAADRKECLPAGAGSVCRMLRSLGSEVVAIGLLGDDRAGREAHRLLSGGGVDAAGLLVEPDRCTPTVERFIGRAAQRHAHQILRVDGERTWPVDEAAERRSIAGLETALPDCDALAITDHGQGLCTPRLVRDAIDVASKQDCPVLIDPGETLDYSAYRGATLITPNRRQAQAASGVEISRGADALLAGSLLCERFGLEAVAIKLDRDGMALVTADGIEQLLPTQAKSVYDVTGARDMVLAMLALALGAGLGMPESARLANLAAGLKLQKQGAALIGRGELRDALSRQSATPQDKVVTLPQMALLAEEHRRQGRQVVFTNGCFDLLHVGHVTYLQQAATLGDVLIVAINSDSSVRSLKGPNRPICPQQARATLLAALDCVDHVLIFDEPTPHVLLRAIRPDVLVKGGTYSSEEVIGREVVLAYGGRVCVAGKVEGLSTTAIVSGLRGELKCRAG